MNTARLDCGCEWSLLPNGGCYQSRVCRQHREPWDYRHPALSSAIFAAIVIGLVAFVVADHMSQKKEHTCSASEQHSTAK